MGRDPGTDQAERQLVRTVPDRTEVRGKAGMEEREPVHWEDPVEQVAGR